MIHTLIVFLLQNRQDNALQVQKTLTEAGCIIKTRLGLHDSTGDVCSSSGLVVLELVGKPSQKQELFEKLSAIEGVTAKLVELEG
ncbi:MAG TPA: hypothetical protein PKL83_00485 [bacterium]|nr:hypothetical protein [bacterium]